MANYDMIRQQVFLGICGGRENMSRTLLLMKSNNNHESRCFLKKISTKKAGVIKEQSPEEIAEEISAKLGSPSLKKFLLEQTMKLVLFFSFLAL